ncbi:MAG: hypothetical protein AAGG09_20300 [Pseudomonadota bacterium]
MALAAAAIFFAIFVTNVALGALAGSAFMGDVQEMLVLLCASVFFVAAILRAEGAEKSKKKQ